jgi:signal transduction histidine kinase
MLAESIPTFFAPAQRASSRDLRRQVGYFSATTMTSRILDAVPSLLMILNSQRQIIYANQALLTLVAGGTKDLVYGMRPGEVLDCIHARKTAGGCGTAEECSTCGAVLGILAGLQGEQAVRECRVTRCREGRQESLDLQVWATPLTYEGEALTVFAVSDISHEKRRRALENIFFHDILNLVGSIKGFAELLRTYDPADKEKIFELVQSAAEQSIDEIMAQRTLAAAESKELALRPEPVPVGDFLRQLVGIYGRHEVAEGRRLLLDPAIPDVVFTTDRALLGRVVGNMIKNALEATAPTEAVTVKCLCADDRIEFAVHNPGVMPREAQLQIFQRSFSTKGRDRGLGTYSMRLLSEYMRGEVAFTSTEEKGTTFSASYPLSLRSC